VSVLGTAAIVKIAFRAINNGIELYKKRTPSWEQKQEFKMINKYYYIKDLYELERRKPRYDEERDDDYNKGARSNDTMLNLRDKLLLVGQEVIDKLRST